MKYSVLMYINGKHVPRNATGDPMSYPTLGKALYVAYKLLELLADEYEITNERGDVVAYAYTEDSPKAIEKANDYAADMKEARADMARDIQRDELASRMHSGVGKS